MPDSQRGLIAVISSSVIWGVLGLYYKLLSHVPALEILSHRTLWSVVFFGAVLAVQGRLPALRRAMTSREGGLILFGALMMGVNWFVYILSIQIGHALESSLGYYIFPMVAVLIGLLVFHERLSWLQWIAVALAATGVLTLTIGLGVAPWFSLAIAVSFGLYGLAKKKITADATVSVTAEVMFLAPLALVWLILPHTEVPGAEHFGSDWRTTLLLIGTGPLTAIPMMLFTYASRRIPMSTLGVVQYINPTIQFLIATLAFGEPFTHAHALAFPMIWLAVLIYIVALRRQASAARKLAASLGTSGTTV